jgi:hypothetical protein
MRTALAAIDTLTNKVVATSRCQAAQAVVYVPNAVPATMEHGNSAMTMMPVVQERAEAETAAAWHRRAIDAIVVGAAGP